MLEHQCKPPEHLVAEIVVRLGLRPEAFSVEPDSADIFHCTGREMPAVRRDQPRPSENLSGTDGLDANESSLACLDFVGNAAVPDEIESVSGFTLVEKKLAVFERNVRCTPDEQLHVDLVEIACERVLAKDYREIFGLHDQSPFGS